MTKNKIPTDHLDNNNGERVRSTSEPIKKLGTIEDYPEYAIVL